jgi:type VI secretion system protein ImpC
MENTPLSSEAPQGGSLAYQEAVSDFESLLQKEFKPQNDTRKTAVQQAVQTLAAQALTNVTLISGDALRTIEGMIAELDKKLSDQLNLIIHHEDFKALEGTWRGLHHLVSNTETDEHLKIRVLNISKKDLGRTLKKHQGANWDQSPVFKKIYEEEFGTPGGAPYGCLIGDYQFDHTVGDVELLTGMAKIAGAAHAPFISAASPSLMGMSSWQELSNPRDLTKILDTAEYAPWKSLRASEDAKYLALTMPRFLARTPYGAKSSPVEEFAFEEDVEGGDHSKYVWSNAAYAMATNITRSFKEFGWCASIRGAESGGRVDGLPCHTFPTDDGGVDMKCPTEISITDRREAELAKNGLMPLSHWKNSDFAVFVGAQSLQKPAEYDNPEATANARLAARLPYLFSTCRFAHYLKCIVRDKIGSFKGKEDMHDMLHDWIVRNYVTTDDRADEVTKAEKPLREARVEVEEIPGNPGYYSAKFWLRPHYQLEGLSVSLRLVSKLPSAKGN